MDTQSDDNQVVSRQKHLALERQLAQQLLAHWQLPAPRLILLAANFNTVYRVESNGATYVLRIQQPNTLNAATINSELAWLTAIKHETDLEVPTPLVSNDGSLLISMPDSHTMRHAALFGWMDGHIVGKGTTPGRLYKVGQMMARLHQQARNFALPANFTRPRWDWNMIFGPNSVLSNGSFNEVVSAADRETFAQASEQVRQAMADLGEGSDSFGIIHNDLHSWNYLYHNGAIKAIDFEISGWGWWIQDMAITIEAVSRKKNPALREAFLQGYISVAPLPHSFSEYEPSFILARLGCHAIWMVETQNPKWLAELPAGLARVANSMREIMQPKAL